MADVTHAFWNNIRCAQNHKMASLLWQQSSCSSLAPANTHRIGILESEINGKRQPIWSWEREHASMETMEQLLQRRCVFHRNFTIAVCLSSFFVHSSNHDDKISPRPHGFRLPEQIPPTGCCIKKVLWPLMEIIITGRIHLPWLALSVQATHQIELWLSITCVWANKRRYVSQSVSGATSEGDD